MIALPLVALDVLVIALWTIAAALAIALIMDKLGSVLGSVPVAGSWLESHVKGMAQAITNACGHLESGTDHLIGAALSHLSRYVDELWNEFAAHSTLIAHLARIVGDGIANVTGIRGTVHDLSKAVHVVLHRFVTIGRELGHLRGRVKALEHEIGHGIGADVLPRIKTLERELGTVEGKILPRVESAEKALANDITALGEYVRNNFVSVATDAVTAVVATALAAMGLGGLRCNSLLSSLSKRGCGLWSGLEDLLGLVIDGLIFVDLCQVIPLIEGVLAEFEGPLVELISTAANAACADPPSGWTALGSPPIFTPAAGEITATI